MNNPSRPSEAPSTPSSALLANLAQTRVEGISIDPQYEVLREVVQDYQGILDALDRLLLELNHPFRNWIVILPELKGFVLKNIGFYLNHDRGPESLLLFHHLFLQAQGEGVRTDLTRPALEALSACLVRAIDLIQPERMAGFRSAFRDIFSDLATLSPDHLRLLGQSPFSIRRGLLVLLPKVRKAGDNTLDLESLKQYSLSSLQASLTYWLSEPDPVQLAGTNSDAFKNIGHESLQRINNQVQHWSAQPPTLHTLDAMLALPDFMDIVHGYQHVSDQIGIVDQGTPETIQAEQNAKLTFLFHIMRTPGLRLIHETTLRSINQTLGHLVRMRQSFDELRAYFYEAFAFFKNNVAAYPHTALQSIEILGDEVFKRDNSRLVEIFLERTVDFGFQYSRITGVSSEWQPLCNPNHLYNIRVWLNLIRRNPPWSPTLFSALIINLKLTGVLIRDTDVFQKEITQLLNSGIRPVYNLARQFCRLLPVYYNEIGAEGLLRDVSTQLDETHQRQDLLIHFLRKQCHVESTNRIVALAQGILHYWRSGNPDHLHELVSDQILSGLEPRGPWFDEVHQITRDLFHQSQATGVETPLLCPSTDVEQWIMKHPNASLHERERVWLLIRLYHLLNRKYNLGFHDIEDSLKTAMDNGISGLEPLHRILTAADGHAPGEEHAKLEALLDALETLNEIILSDETFPAHEEIYQKRHIAVDIPSVYGRYAEKKFDALSLSLRLENLATVELEGLVERIHGDFITRSAFFRVHRYTRYFLRALRLDGISSRRLDNLNDVLQRFLEFNDFTFHQYLDVFRSFAEGVKDLINTYFTTHHRDTLATIIPMIPKSALLPKYHPLVADDAAITVEQISESFLRDLVAETFGLQAFDRFISRLLRLLRLQEQRLPLPLLNQLMNYHPGRLFHSFTDPRRQTLDLLHLGAKGFNLLDLASDKLPVPAGTVLTTEYFRCHEVIQGYPPAKDDFMARLQTHLRHIEAQCDAKFGDAGQPLLLSVRSGALFSMPGMMQTIHNVGINTDIVQALGNKTGNPYFAWDNYRRFIQSWCATLDMDRTIFTNLMHAHKKQAGVRWKQEFNAEQIRALTLDYLAAARDHGVQIPDDPMEQLLGAIRQVVDSWNSLKAREYRQIMDLSDAWGTAAVIQRMIFGNLNRLSGSGVLFTAHPHRKLDRVLLWGDYTTGNQGEDVVNGLVTTRPISLDQCEYENRDPQSSLELCFPEIYCRLHGIATHLIYDRRWNPQELEFTFEGPERDDLYLLQSRDMVTSKNRAPAYNRFQESPTLRENRIVQGIGVAGGALCGRAVFNLEQIHRMKEQFGEEPLILIRHDTVPDDIKEVSLTQGLVTSRGGQTCHAAIVAAKMEKTCIVGCEELIVQQDMAKSTTSDRVIRCGDPISIDGFRGLLYQGWFPVERHVELNRS
ncbi:MAG: phosphoenolpyruvate synthase [Magnetococcales bacterium]|nr:phosphoenolpyruvate synthase [Magnetococcales bacterium]